MVRPSIEAEKEKSPTSENVRKKRQSYCRHPIAKREKRGSREAIGRIIINKKKETDEQKGGEREKGPFEGQKRPHSFPRSSPPFRENGLQEKKDRRQGGHHR